jgi:hypothetical protein
MEKFKKKYGFLERPGKECWNAIQESSRKQKEKLKRRFKKSSEGIMEKAYLM